MQDSAEHWSAVSRNLDVALDLPEGERDAWLGGLAVRSPDVAAEVRRLLQSRAQPDFERFLSGNAAKALIAMPAVDLAGRSVGPYVIESEIGRGGMGSVWLAHRADGQYEGRVAVKFLATAWSGTDGQERFRREGRLLARLDHSNIARLLDAGVMDTAQPYLVLEYVEGEHIDKYCDSRRLDVIARVRLFLAVLDAVAHAHSHLVIHRDIKPPNILVTHAGKVKLLDFGVARLLGEDAMHTRAGQGMFTPQYAAPEQVLGDELTTATDVHSLGLVLYVLLTGRHPFAGPTSSSAEIVRRVVETDAELLSVMATANFPAGSLSHWALRRAASPGGLGRMLRGDLDNIVAKALRKEPARRYASAGAFAEDLRRFLTHEPVSARADTVGYRAAKFVRRHRGGVASALLFALTLVLAVIITTAQMHEARVQRDDALFQSRRAESANEFMNALLQTDGGSGPVARTHEDRLKLGVELLEKQYAGDPRFAGRMLVQLGKQFRGLTETKTAVEVFERAYQLGAKTGDAELMAVARCASSDAQLSARAGGNAAEQLAEAGALLARIGGGSVLTQADCLQAEGGLAKRERDFAKAILRFQQAQRILESSGNTHRAIYASILTDLGGIYIERERLAEAVQMADLVMATHERFGRGGTTAHLTAMQNRVTALASMGEIREALAQRAAISERLRVLETPGKEPLYYPINYAGMLTRGGKPVQALQELSGVVERARDAGNPMWQIGALNAAAAAHLALHDLPPAEAAMTQAVQVLGTMQSDNRELRLRVDRIAAMLDLERGDAAGAGARIASMLAAVDYPKVKPSRATYFVLLTAADVALADKRAADAQDMAGAALATAEAVERGPDTSADVGDALLRLARAKVALGKRGEARALLERAGHCLANGYGKDHPMTRQAHTELAALGSR
jgi:serine/threonine protein kinase